jgi:RNA polymerase sigma-70 factor (ECF subfamily)
MMKRFFFLLLIFSLAAVPVSAGDEISVETMPPSVIKTVPQAGDTNVDPSLKEISVTFSKEMMTNDQWSFLHYTLETFPQIDKNNIRFLDKRTCVLPVKLKPGKTYVIRINSQQYNYFMDKNGNSAVPYLLVFETRK